MTTKQVEVEEEVVPDAEEEQESGETPAPAIAKAEEQKETLETEVARLRKELQTLKSVQGSQRKRDALDARIDRVLEKLEDTDSKIGRLREENGLLFEHMAAPEEERSPEVLKTKRAQMTAAEREAQEKSTFAKREESTYGEMNARVGRLVKAGVPFEDIRKDPDFTAAQDIFEKAVKDRNRDGLADALIAVGRLVDKYNDKRVEAAAEAARAEGRKAEREALGLTGTTTPKGAGGGEAAQLQELVNRYGRGEDLSVADAVKVADAMDKGMRPKR